MVGIMQINRDYNNPNFKGLWNNKLVLKSLEKVSEHGTTFAASTSLVMSLGVRPLSILSTPNVEKENKQYASTNSICSGLIKFGLIEAVALPIENAVKKIDKTPSKYLKNTTIKNLQDNSKSLAETRSYKLATQIIKLSTGIITAIPKSIMTIALIPIVMDKLFNIKVNEDQNKNLKTSTDRKIKKSENIPFTGKLQEKIPQTLGKIIDFNFFQNFVKKHQNQDKDIAKHITAATDILLTGTFAYQTNKSKRIKEERKKALIYNNVISTGITLLGGYSIDRIIKNKTNKFIEKFSKINANDPKLSKYIEGLHIVRPAIIFAGIYYGILPMISTFLAEKTDKFLQKNQTL